MTSPKAAVKITQPYQFEEIGPSFQYFMAEDLPKVHVSTYKMSLLAGIVFGLASSPLVFSITKPNP